MPAGRPRKPMSIKLLEGTYRPNQDGPIGAAVQASGAPVEPKGLKGDALALWRRVVPLLIECRVVTALDQESLEELCWWWAQWQRMRKAVDKSPTSTSLSGLASSASKQFNLLAARFGMTPSDRAKLRLEPIAPPETPVPARKRSQ